MIKMSRNLLLIKLETEKVDTKGVILPDNVKESINEQRANMSGKGEIMALGPDCKTYKKGDIVRYPGYIGNLVEDKELGKGLFTVVAENDIIIGFTK